MTTTTLKTLMVVTALLAGGNSLVSAQNGTPAAGHLPVAGGAAASPAVPGRTAHHHGTKHHRMYMISVNRIHKGSKLTPASNAKLQMKQ
jgi:hypothetical protein